MLHNESSVESQGGICMKLYHTEEARKSAVSEIDRLMQIVSTIPGNIVGYLDTSSINRYLSLYRHAIEQENKEQMKHYSRSEV